MQSLKAELPNFVTLLGIVIFVSFAQPLKAEMPMCLTFLGIVMLVRFMHPSKALSLILSTLSGIIISVRLVRLRNVSLAISIVFGLIVNLPGLSIFAYIK